MTGLFARARARSFGVHPRTADGTPCPPEPTRPPLGSTGSSQPACGGLVRGVGPSAWDRYLDPAFVPDVMPGMSLRDRDRCRAQMRERRDAALAVYGPL